MPCHGHKCSRDLVSLAQFLIASSSFIAILQSWLHRIGSLSLCCNRRWAASFVGARFHRSLHFPCSGVLTPSFEEHSTINQFASQDHWSSCPTRFPNPSRLFASTRIFAPKALSLKWLGQLVLMNPPVFPNEAVLAYRQTFVSLLR